MSKLDRLARSIRDLFTIIDRLRAKGVSLRILNIGIDTGSATGKLVLSVLGGIAEVEREMLLERQREGIAKAKAEGRYKGRVPTAWRKAAEVSRLKAEGLAATEFARKLSIGRASVYRVLSDLSHIAGQ
jgi:DNA invertase Pin-like site-specific DNA recombinase